MSKADKQSKYALKGGPYRYSEQFQQWDRAIRDPNASQLDRDELAGKHVAYCARVFGKI